MYGKGDTMERGGNHALNFLFVFLAFGILICFEFSASCLEFPLFSFIALTLSAYGEGLALKEN